MQARLEECGNVTVIHLMGRVSQESIEPFRQACSANFKDRALVFDFAKLSFVGSNGILPFLDVMQKFKVNNSAEFKFSNVGIEFRRLFAATLLRDVKIYEAQEMAVRPFTDPQVPTLLVDAGPETPLLSLEGLFTAPELSIAESEDCGSDEADGESAIDSDEAVVL